MDQPMSKTFEESMVLKDTACTAPNGTVSTSASFDTSEKAAIPSIDADSSKSNSLEHASTSSDNTRAAEMTRAKQILLTVAISLAAFLFSLDESIISTAIPKVTNRFNSLNDVGWYGSAYLLMSCAFQFSYGKLYTFYSSKWTFMAAILIFEIGSAICGAAPNSPSFIVGRAISGLGASGIISGALNIITQAVPIRQRPIYFAGIGVIAGLASLSAPLLGGAFTDSSLTWRWCFYINLPLGAFTLIVVGLFFHPENQARSGEKVTWKQEIARFDLLGLLFIIPGLICLLLAFQWGGSKYDWSNWRVILLLVMFVVLAAVFIVIQIREKENATLPRRIISQKNIIYGSLYAMSIDGVYYTLQYYLAIWFQAIEGTSAEESGIRSLPLIASMVVSNLAAGALVTKWGYYHPFMFAATIFEAVGSGLMTTFTRNTTMGEWIAYPLLVGAGCGTGMQQAIIAVQTVLSEEDQAMGLSVIVFFQVLGPALLLSVAQNIFQNRLIAESEGIPGVNRTLLLDTGATSLKDAIPPAQLDAVLHAYNEAIVETWYAPVAIASLSVLGIIGMEWKKIGGHDKKEEEETGTASMDEVKTS